MKSCVVLGDADIHDILINLSREETHTFLNQVADSLKDYSTAAERSCQPDPAIVKRDGRRNIFRLFTSSTGVGVKIIVDPSEALSLQEAPKTEAARVERNKLVGLHGIIALCDENGFPEGFLNAEEVTAYRTSLSAMILYVRRHKTANIVIFGAGKQALWHARLALVLRGEDIRQITIINRSAERTASLIAQITSENDQRWKTKVKIQSVLAEDTETIRTVLGEADVVFCTTPSKVCLFPADCLTNRQEGCYLSAIGSYQSDMIELDPEILRNVAERSAERGMVVVDDRADCMHSAGEVVQSKLEKEKIAEIGEVMEMVTGTATELQAKTVRCLEDGFVVYKSVGVSLTDLCAGQVLLALARKRDRGIAVPDF